VSAGASVVRDMMFRSVNQQKEEMIKKTERGSYILKGIATPQGGLKVRS